MVKLVIVSHPSLILPPNISQEIRYKFSKLRHRFSRVKEETISKVKISLWNYFVGLLFFQRNYLPISSMVLTIYYFFFLFFFLEIYLFERQKEQGPRERERILNRLQVQCRARCRNRSHYPKIQIKSWMPNPVSHPGGPHLVFFFFFTSFSHPNVV